MEDGDGVVEYTVMEGGVVNGNKAVVLCVVEGAFVLEAVVALGLGLDDVVLVLAVEVEVVDGGVEGVEGSVFVGVVVVVLGFCTVLGERESEGRELSHSSWFTRLDNKFRF